MNVSEKELQRQIQEKDKEIERLENRITDLETKRREDAEKYEREMKFFRIQLREANKERTELRNEIKSMQDVHRKDMESMKDVHRKDMESMKDVHSKDMESMKEEHNKEMRSLKEQLDDIHVRLDMHSHRTPGNAQAPITQPRLQQQEANLEQDPTEQDNAGSLDRTADSNPNHNKISKTCNLL